MRSPKVRLYIRVRLSDGRYAHADPVWNRNRTLRAGYALVGGQPEVHPEGIYYVRFLRGRKRVWRAIGADADAAVVAVQNLEHDLQSISLGRSALSSATSPTPESPTSVSLDAAIKSYVSQLGLFRAPKTVREAKRILELFGKRFPGKAIQSITREDLLDHMASLQGEGLGLRTISNHITRIGALLRKHKIVDLLSREDKPQYDEPEVEAYSPDELTALFAAATPEERMLFEFFLGTGFREQEVMFLAERRLKRQGDRRQVEAGAWVQVEG